jgi:hypothetical protein
LLTVGLGSVVEVDAEIPCLLDALGGQVLRLLGVGVDPVAVGNDGDLDAGGAQEAVLHAANKICNYGRLDRSELITNNISEKIIWGRRDGEDAWRLFSIGKVLILM